MVQVGYTVGEGTGADFVDPPGAIQLTSLTGAETVVVWNNGALLAICTTALIAGLAGTTGFQGSLTATGTNQATALPITGGLAIVTTTPPGTGVRLQTTVGIALGSTQRIVNWGANNLLVYPDGADQINANGAGNPVAIGPSGGAADFTINAVGEIYQS